MNAEKTGRPPMDPSGRKRETAIMLSPRHIEVLDKHAEARGVSRSALVAKLLDRLDSTPSPAAQVRQKETPVHEHRWEIKTGGIKTCAVLGCEEVKR